MHKAFCSVCGYLFLGSLVRNFDRTYRNKLATANFVPWPIEIRFCEPNNATGHTKSPPSLRYWFRAKGKLSDDQALHRYSLSVDGILSDQLGAEVMESGAYYSKLLQEYDAVVVFSFFVSTKHYVLSSKEPGAQPLLIVLAKSSGSLQLPAVTTTSSRTIIFRDEEIVMELEANQRGIETVVLDWMNLTAILEHRKRQGLCSVMMDFRGNSSKFEEILQDGFEQNLFQKVVVEVLPIFGASCKEACKYMQQNRRLKSLTSMTLGEIILLEGYFQVV